MSARPTVRLTMAQALLRFLDNQYVELDGEEHAFFRGVLGIFGHGNVTGLGEALEYRELRMPFLRGNNEQGLVHTAAAYAKRKNRLETFVCTSSIGPGATNMVTGAAAATINRIPVLLLPGDIFADRQPDPVLQQLECPGDHTLSVNDCFKPVSRYWDRILRPEQLITAALDAMRVLTDPVDTGAVTLCLPQDVQAEAWDYPEELFRRRVWRIERRALSERAVALAVERLRGAERPLLVVGGGVHYSLAVEQLRDFASRHGIPVAETQAGKSAMDWRDPMSVGGIGVTGTLAANRLAHEADVILAVGTRLSDFTTASKRLFQREGQELLHLNVSRLDGAKSNGELLLGDARLGLEAIGAALDGHRTSEVYRARVAELRSAWDAEVDRLYKLDDADGNPQTAVLGRLNEALRPHDVVVCAAGSLPGDLHRLWRCSVPGTYHLEYGYSCMGYEVAGALGVKLADPEAEVWAVVGDGSFLMLHSELVTAIQEGIKINVLLFDNHGFQCIRGLQQSQGSQGFGNELRYREPEGLSGEYLPIDFAAYAAALGAESTKVDDLAGLDAALEQAKRASGPVVITIEVQPESMSGGYESWWRVPVAEVSTSSEVAAAHESMCRELDEAERF